MQVPGHRKLHLGCGQVILPGFVNIDLVPAPGVDLVHDLRLGLPYPDDCAEEVLAIDVLDHIPTGDVIHVMNEIHRVLAPGGLLRLQVSCAPGITAFQDPTHRSFWNEESFTYYEDGHRRRERYGVTYGVRARFVRRKLRRRRHLWARFFSTLDLNYLSNFLLEVELVAVK